MPQSLANAPKHSSRNAAVGRAPRSAPPLLKADDNTLRLINMGQQTLYFFHRPVRIAGHLTMPAYMDEWKAGEGPNNFSANPPNATLSVYEAGRNENTLAVIEISHPVIDPKDLV